MGAAPKLTPKQWDEISDRLLAGESGRSLAKEFGVSETAIRKRHGSQTKAIKSVANQIVTTDKNFKQLSVGSQIKARTLADKLINLSNHLLSAAEFGAMTANKLSGIANTKANSISETADIDEDAMEKLKGIAVLTRMANASSEIGINLLRVNKEAVDEMGKEEEEALPVTVIINKKSARKETQINE